MPASLADPLAAAGVPLAATATLGSWSTAPGTALAAELASISTFVVGFGFEIASRFGIHEPFL